MAKPFRLSAEQIAKVAPGFGACYATDRITVDGKKVGLAYREAPDFPNDSGWRFFAGDETQAYVDDPSNTEIYDVNTIANYDPEIIPILTSRAPVDFERSTPSSPLIRVMRP